MGVWIVPIIMRASRVAYVRPCTNAQKTSGTTSSTSIGLTKTASLEYARSGIRVNAVCPGYIRTPLIENALLSRPEMEEQIVARHPVGRMGTPEEIAEAVVWLCSDAASFVTGHTMTVDGGYVAQ